MTLTASYIKTRLQIANCCAGKMGSAAIAKMRKGNPCECEWEELEVMTALIDSIRDYAVVITQPFMLFDVTATVIAGTTTITINSVAVVVVVSATGVAATHAQEIAAAINAAYPGVPYQATVSGATVTITGVLGAVQNTYAVSIVGSVGMGYNLPFPTELSGGVDYISATETTCLSEEQINDILERLCQMCKCKGCNEVVNFANSDNNKF